MFFVIVLSLTDLFLPTLSLIWVVIQSEILYIMIHYTQWLKSLPPHQVISFLAAVLHKKGTREDIENNMPEFLLRNIKKESTSSTAKKVKYLQIFDIEAFKYHTIYYKI